MAKVVTPTRNAPHGFRRVEVGDWDQCLQGQHIIIAHEDRRAVGFMSLAAEGYVDFAYIRPEAQGTGLFRQLLGHIAVRASEKGVRLLWTHASLMAEPAFEKLGFTVRRRERVRLGNQEFDRCEMEKVLDGAYLVENFR